MTSRKAKRFCEIEFTFEGNLADVSRMRAIAGSQISLYWRGYLRYGAPPEKRIRLDIPIPKKADSSWVRWVTAVPSLNAEELRERMTEQFSARVNLRLWLSQSDLATSIEHLRQTHEIDPDKVAQLFERAFARDATAKKEWMILSMKTNQTIRDLMLKFRIPLSHSDTFIGYVLTGQHRLELEDKEDLLADPFHSYLNGFAYVESIDDHPPQLLVQYFGTTSRKQFGRVHEVLSYLRESYLPEWRSTTRQPDPEVAIKLLELDHSTPEGSDVTKADDLYGSVDDTADGDLSEIDRKRGNQLRSQRARLKQKSLRERGLKE